MTSDMYSNTNPFRSRYQNTPGEAVHEWQPWKSFGKQNQVSERTGTSDNSCVPSRYQDLHNIHITYRRDGMMFYKSRGILVAMMVTIFVRAGRLSASPTITFFLNQKILTDDVNFHLDPLNLNICTGSYASQRHWHVSCS
eukprot:g69153.t1